MYEEQQFEAMKERLESYDQGHVLKNFEKLSEASQTTLLAQIESIDFELLSDLLEEYKNSGKLGKKELRPAETICHPENDKQRADFRKARNRGEELLKAGKVAAFLVAGGQGTRLGLPGPKGTFPVYPVTGKSLFEIFAQKLLNLRGKYGKSIPLYVMTSPENDEETRAYFAAFNFFKLERSSVKFIKQGTLPSVDLWGNLVSDQSGHIFESPNGHGGAIYAMRDHGVIRDLIDRGYEELFYFQVDNPMAKICDPVFIGFHNLRRADVSTKSVEKVKPDEKVGVIGYIDGKPGVIEYSELSFEQLHDVRKDGRLRYSAGNTAIHVFNLAFLDNLISGSKELPYHFALKSMKNIEGGIVEVLKFERFIFDAMKFAGKVVVFEIDRDEEFAPLKNAVGVDSPNQVRVSLLEMWCGWLKSAGISVPRDEKGNIKGVFEINPIFADSCEELIEKLPSNWTYRDGAIL